MVTATAEQERERRRKEREARRLEDLAEEHTKAAAEAAAAAEAKRQRTEEDAGANKRHRGEESTKTPIDVTGDDGSAGESTNKHIQDVNQAGRDAEMPGTASDEDKEGHQCPERSPKKKKKRKDKQKEKNKEKEKDKPSILNPGWFSPAAKVTKKVTVTDKRKSEWCVHS
jgi:hypothetical protein